MANYGAAGPGPQPWHEPRPGEWYDHARSSDPRPPHDPGRGYESGHTYGGQSHDGGPAYDEGRLYGSGQDYGSERNYRSGQGHGARREHGIRQDHGSGHGHGSGYGHGPGESYDPVGYAGGAYGTVGSGQVPQSPGAWARSTHQQDAETGYAGTPVPPPQRRRGRTLVALAVVSMLVLGGVTVAYLVGRDEEAPTPVAAPTEEAPPAPDARDEEEARPDDPASAASADPRFVQAGQCVRNDAAAGGRPRLLLSDCVPRSYEVLRRFDGKTSGERDAEEKCAAVDGYTNWYFYDSELDSLDFVLCLKLRD